jgi:EmrB/QacA subfamily drug resistance transporter
MRRFDYKWIVGLIFVFGLFMELLDMTIVNVAVPTLVEDFHAETTTIEWVITGYLVALAIFIPVSGWAGDRFGTKRTFIFALIVFTSGSLLCGLAWNIESLIAFRVLQGVGGGMLTPVGTAMVFRAFPPVERATAASILAIPAAVAPATGPVVGGWLVEFYSWRWIFFVNIPIGLVALVLAALLLREEKQEQTGRLDVPGFLLGAGGLASVLYALAEAGSHGFDDPQVLLFGLGGLAMLATFALVELRTHQPMIDIRLFRNRLFAASNSVQLAGYAGFAGALFLLPLLLQAEMGLSPLESGLTTFPQAIGVAMIVRPAEWLYRRIGPRRIMMTGLLGAAATALMFLGVDLQTDQWWIRAIMLMRGWSFGFVLVAMQTATFATISPVDTGRASAVANATRQIAASFGVALLATVLSSRLIHYGSALGDPATGGDALLAFHEAFMVAAGLSVIGLFVAFRVSDREAAGTMLQRAPAEVAPAGERSPPAGTAQPNPTAAAKETAGLRGATTPSSGPAGPPS